MKKIKGEKMKTNAILEYMLAQLDLARYWLKEFENCTKEEIIKSIKKFICETSQGAYCNEEE